jgi:hypothetical protein
MHRSYVDHSLPTYLLRTTYRYHYDLALLHCYYNPCACIVVRGQQLSEFDTFDLSDQPSEDQSASLLHDDSIKDGSGADCYEDFDNMQNIQGYDNGINTNNPERDFNALEYSSIESQQQQPKHASHQNDTSSRTNGMRELGLAIWYAENGVDKFEPVNGEAVDQSVTINIVDIKTNTPLSIDAIQNSNKSDHNIITPTVNSHFFPSNGNGAMIHYHSPQPNSTHVSPQPPNENISMSVTAAEVTSSASDSASAEITPTNDNNSINNNSVFLGNNSTLTNINNNTGGMIASSYYSPRLQSQTQSSMLNINNTNGENSINHKNVARDSTSLAYNDFQFKQQTQIQSHNNNNNNNHNHNNNNHNNNNHNNNNNNKTVDNSLNSYQTSQQFNTCITPAWDQLQQRQQQQKNQQHQQQYQQKQQQHQHQHQQQLQEQHDKQRKRDRRFYDAFQNIKRDCSSLLGVYIQAEKNVNITIDSVMKILNGLKADLTKIQNDRKNTIEQIRHSMQRCQKKYHSISKKSSSSSSSNSGSQRGYNHRAPSTVNMNFLNTTTINHMNTSHQNNLHANNATVALTPTHSNNNNNNNNNNVNGASSTSNTNHRSEFQIFHPSMSALNSTLLSQSQVQNQNQNQNQAHVSISNSNRLLQHGLNNGVNHNNSNSNNNSRSRFQEQSNSNGGAINGYANNVYTNMITNTNTNTNTNANVVTTFNTRCNTGNQINSNSNSNSNSNQQPYNTNNNHNNEQSIINNKLGGGIDHDVDSFNSTMDDDNISLNDQDIYTKHSNNNNNNNNNNNAPSFGNSKSNANIALESNAS